jgi:predicted nicotinamide N-methyase
MPGYRTRQQQVQVGSERRLHLQGLLDRQQFSDPSGAAAALGISSAAWPLFGLLWPSSLRLAERLALRPVTGERILELGCGLALPSLVGHRRGADITASDCHPLSGRFLRRNVRLNALAPLAYRHGDWAAAPDDAPGPSPGLAALPSPHPAAPGGTARHLPAPRVRGRFGLLIGSDLLYERDEHGHLAGFIDRHAEAASEVWIVDPDRGNRAAFSREMTQHGFSVREERLDRAADGALEAYKGRLLVYRRGPEVDPACIPSFGAALDPAANPFSPASRRAG